MKEVILVKYGEIVLKGLNKSSFEKMLIKNVRRALKPYGDCKVEWSQSTMRIIPADENSTDECMEAVSKVFGIAGLSRAGVCEKDINSIMDCASEYLRDQLEEVKSFKVECKRSDKSFPLKSPEISAEVGARILEDYPHLHVDVHNPDMVVRCEVRDFAAYVHGNPTPGAGGLPVGTGGRAAIMISGGIDSPVAAWMMAKRGVELTAVHFASPPYTSERAEQKVVDLLGKVSDWAGVIKLYVVEFTEFQEAIRDHCPEDLFTVIMRRYMIRIAEEIAKSQHCLALISGESLGQVASQTLAAICRTDECATMPILRPLIGMDKEEIVRISRRIGSFELSILPYEDCCTVFTPKHPRTKPTAAMVEEAEAMLPNVEEMIRRAVESARKHFIAPNRN